MEAIKIPLKVDLLKCPISILDYNCLESSIEHAVKNNKRLTIMYANTLTVNLCNQDSHFKNVVNSFDVVHPDGIGVWLGNIVLQERKLRFDRFNWTDHGYKFIEKCSKEKWKIYFFGSEETVISEAAKKIKEKYPKLNLVGYSNGYEDLKNKEKLVSNINNSRAEILWIGLGTPLQEKWVFDNLDKLQNVRIVQTVGDLFGLFAGTKPRGNAIIRVIGLEWFVRLMANPKRYWRRVIIGFPQFILRVLKKKFSRD